MSQLLTCFLDSPVWRQSSCFSASVGYGCPRWIKSHCFNEAVTSPGKLGRFLMDREKLPSAGGQDAKNVSSSSPSPPSWFVEGFFRVPPTRTFGFGRVGGAVVAMAVVMGFSGSISKLLPSMGGTGSVWGFITCTFLSIAQRSSHRIAKDMRTMWLVATTMESTYGICRQSHFCSSTGGGGSGVGGGGGGVI